MSYPELVAWQLYPSWRVSFRQYRDEMFKMNDYFICIGPLQTRWEWWD